MPELSPLEIVARPVDLPVDHGDGPPLADYVALMQQIRDLRAELEEERRERRRADDVAWASVAERLDALAGRWPPADGPVAELLAALALLWEQQEIELVRVTGRRVADVSPEEFEVFCTQDAACAADDGLVVETFRPLVRRRGRVIRPGQIVVLRQPSPSSEKAS